MLLGWIIVFSVLGSLGAIAGAALMLLFPDKARKSILPCLISYATGTLLGAAFLGMIPKALAHAAPIAVCGTVLAGIVLFFALEKMVIWRHCHDETCEVHASSGPLLLIGDAFHNFVDGFVIAAAFLTSIPFGIAASLAVIAHEIPQEVGDFAILLENGYSRLKALILNSMSSITTLPGAIIAYYFLGETQQAIPYILALSAASFIYIALADLMPGLHRRMTPGSVLLQFTLIAAGIGTIGLIQFAH
ncbi:ZIP family metal transporter [Parasphingorhabdus sp.]|uniref:ZIP family metal transporter n=1 Tax=Parasphingorhabdus sp. TaxID=2709688 RepID=UPI002F929F74